MSRLLRFLFPFSCCLFLLALLCAACTTLISPDPRSSVVPGSSSTATPPDPAGSQSDSSSAASRPDPSKSASSQPQQPDVSLLPDPLPEYDFSLPVAEGEKVPVDYFDDAAFIGDSRTDGMLLYSGMTHGDKLVANGMSIFKVEEKKVLTIDGEKFTLLEALERKQYGKVYLCLGVNELGYFDDNGFYEHYCQVLDHIRACQPNAVIYVQNLIPLNESVAAATGGASYLTNKHLYVYNDLIRKAAEEKQVAFIDLYSAFEENGILPADASKDGFHLTSPYCKQWMEYLQTHTVDFDTLYPNGAPTVQEAAQP